MVMAIYGAGGHGRDIADTMGYYFGGFVDDNPDIDCKRAEGDYWIRYIGINDPAGRRALAERLGWEPREPRLHQIKTRQDSSRMYRHDVHWRCRGTWVHPDASIGPDVWVGEHTHINANAFLTRCVLGDFVTIGPGATVCGDVTIGNDVQIGAGAVVKNLITIGDGATIGCGAVVIRDVEPGDTVAGNPARSIVGSDELVILS